MFSVGNKLSGCGKGRSWQRTAAVILLGALTVAYFIGTRGRVLPTTHAAMFNVITVNTTADENGTNAGACSLREAIIAANTNAAVGGCPAGSPGLDTIQFNLGAGTPTINIVSNPLDLITEPLNINGNTGGATRVELNGAALMGNPSGLTLHAGADGSTIRSLVINRFGYGLGLIISGGHTVQDCYIGTDATGMVDLGNVTGGIGIADSANNLIGGTLPGQRNVLSGNGAYGIVFNTTGLNQASSGNQIKGNYIGVNAAGTGALGNGTSGVSIYDSPGNFIGGTAAGEGNLIANQTNGSGIVVYGNDSIGNALRGNAIFNNAVKGINLNFSPNPNPNDAGDGDNGPNKLQNFPVLDPITVAGTVTGTLDSTPGNSAYPVRIEFFASTSCDANGHGEGEVFLGATTLNAPGNFSFNFAPIVGKQVITATATDNNGNTSEFSACRAICPTSFTVNDLGDTADAAAGDALCADGTGKCTLRAAIQEANALPACAPLTINFSVTGQINLASALPNLNHPNLIINGPGAALLNVHRNSASNFRIFTIPANRLITLNGLAISNGNANDGGGIQNSGSLTVNQCVITGNLAGGNGGGGIQNFGTLNLNQSTLAGNSASFVGGGLGMINGGTANINGSTISGNTASQGGAISVQAFAAVPANVTIINSTISGNTGTTYAGGVQNIASGGTTAMTINHCTIANNAGGYGSGISNGVNSGSATLSIRNSIVAGNTGSAQLGKNAPAVTTSLGNNLISDASLVPAAGDLLNTNPLLAPLGNYGGPSFTRALLPGSPAINAASNPTSVATDQRGVARAQQGVADIGAYESRGFALAVTGGNNQSTSINTAFATPLQVTASNPYGEPVSGGVAVFTAPANGPSATLAGNPAIFNAQGQAAVTATANQLMGNYQVTAGTNGANSVAFNLTNTCPVITLNPASLPNGLMGAPYNQAITATPAGQYTFTVQGNLPPGLTLSNNGVLSGTPTASGNFTFTVTATSAGPCANTQTYNLLITTCAAITVNPASLPAATVGTAYNQMISASGGVGPYTFSINSGALPAGLTLDTNTGALSGTPTQGGTAVFTIKATGAGGCMGTRTYVLTVNCSAATFNPATLPNGTAGVSYNQQLTVTPVGNYTFSLHLGQLPPGFTLSATGVISGISNQSGTYNFTVKVMAGSCQSTKAYTLVIGSGAMAKQASTASTAALALHGDYDGDGQNDLSLWSAETGGWSIALSHNNQTVKQSWGTKGDMTLLGDYDGDGKTDLAVFRPSNATFYVKQSSNSSALVKQWGLPTDVPVPGDYDGDGKTDIAVWRGAEGNWYILYSGRSSDSQVQVIAWGSSEAPYNDVPVAGDYDGDGKTDVAVFRRATGAWLIKNSSDGKSQVKPWGLGSDVPVVGDYDGDGRCDFAVWRASNGTWYVLRSADNTYQIQAWGVASDVPAPGDFDGDGQTDLTVWRAAENQWYVLNSGDQTKRVQPHGEQRAVPIGSR